MPKNRFWLPIIMVILGLALLLLAACQEPEGPDPLTIQATAAAQAAAAATADVNNLVLLPDVRTSLWDVDPANDLRVSNLGGEQAIPKVIGAEDGDFYVAWYANPDGSSYDLRLQRFDGGGNALWEPNGRVISDSPSTSLSSDYPLTVDKEGNPILVIQDMRSGSNNIYAYKISPEGQFLWGEDGLALSDHESFEAPSPSSVVTEEHLTFVWVRELMTRSIIVLQKLTPDGQNVWGANGLIIQGAARESYIKPVITAGGQDNIILVWGLEKESDSQLMDLYAQKLNGNGASVWNEGAPLLIAESVPFFVQPALVSDGVGGAFVAWHNTELKSYVQHINSNGYFSMAEGGAPVANSGDNKQILPQLQFSPEGQTLFVFWLETDPGQTMRGIGGQKMNVNGWQLWGESGKTVVASSSADLTAVTPRLLGYDIVIFYLQGAEEQGVNPLESQVKAMLLDVAGNPFWGDQPAIISSVLSVKGGLEVGRILNQESIAVWVDMRDNGRDIYMHNLPQAVLFEQAHPATTFCSAHGGVWEYRYNDAGEGVDLCVFPDGSICEEWSYYLKECHPGEAWELDPGT